MNKTTGSRSHTILRSFQMSPFETVVRGAIVQVFTWWWCYTSWFGQWGPLEILLGSPSTYHGSIATAPSIVPPTPLPSMTSWGSLLYSAATNNRGLRYRYRVWPRSPNNFTGFSALSSSKFPSSNLAVSLDCYAFPSSMPGVTLSFSCLADMVSRSSPLCYGLAERWSGFKIVEKCTRRFGIEEYILLSLNFVLDCTVIGLPNTGLWIRWFSRTSPYLFMPIGNVIEYGGWAVHFYSESWVCQCD